MVKTRDACISGNCECPVSAGPGCTPPVESDITAACVGRTGVDNAKCRTEFYNTFVTKFLEPEFARKYVRFRDLIGGFLDPSERDLALCMDRPDVAPALATASPRFRYIAWFRDLNDKVAATQKLPCPLSLPLLAAPATAPAT